MPNPEANPESHSRHIIDVPKYPKAYSMPAVVHEAVDSLVYSANHSGAKTNKSEMVAVLIHHALTNMSDEELTSAWLAYRHADEDRLRSSPPLSSE